MAQFKVSIAHSSSLPSQTFTQDSNAFACNMWKKFSFSSLSFVFALLIFSSGQQHAFAANNEAVRPPAAASKQACLDEARRLQALHKPEEVIKLLNVCIRDTHDVVALYWYRAQAFMALKRYREAILDCTSQIKIAGDLVKPFEMRAECYEALKEKSKAVKDWKRIVQIQPNNVSAHQHLAQHHKELGDSRGFQREMALAKKAPAQGANKRAFIDPATFTKNDKPASDLFESATESLARGKPSQTLEQCKKLLSYSELQLTIERMPRTEIYELQAQAFQKLGAHDKAIAAIGEAVKLAPNSRRSYFIRAQSEFELGRYAACLVDCDKAAEGDAILRDTVAKLRAKALAASKASDAKSLKPTLDEKKR